MKAAGVQSSEGPVKEIVLGVDTHLDAHLAVALDALGRHLGESKIPTTLRGYGQLLHWAQSLGVVRCAGVEGTGCYGAGLARYLRKAGIAVFEVERPKRRLPQARREERLAGRRGCSPGGALGRDGRRAQEWGWSRGDDPGIESRSPFCGEGQESGR